MHSHRSYSATLIPNSRFHPKRAQVNHSVFQKITRICKRKRPGFLQDRMRRKFTKRPVTMRGVPQQHHHVFVIDPGQEGWFLGPISCFSKTFFKAKRIILHDCTGTYQSSAVWCTLIHSLARLWLCTYSSHGCKQVFADVWIFPKGRAQSEIRRYYWGSGI